MNKFFCIAVCFPLAVLSSCGGKGEVAEKGEDSVAAVGIKQGTDTLTDREWEDSRTEKNDGHEYKISLKRHPDKSLAKV